MKKIKPFLEKYLSNAGCNIFKLINKLIILNLTAEPLNLQLWQSNMKLYQETKCKKNRFQMGREMSPGTCFTLTGYEQCQKVY